MPENMEVTHINLNDNTVEGMRHKELPIYSVQYHPEACPPRARSEDCQVTWLRHALRQLE